MSTHRSKIRSSLREMSQSLCEEAKEGEENERLYLPLLGAPPWKECRRWICHPDLLGNSNKSSREDVLTEDAMNTIRVRFSDVPYVIYTDGSAMEGFRNGGSAAVVTTGPCENPEVITALRSKGRTTTSSFETELKAIQLAVDWIKTQPPGHYAICTDSKASVLALQGVEVKAVDVKDTRTALDGAAGTVSLQWIPSHIGIPGNEDADRAANEAAAATGPHDPNISYGSAIATIRKELWTRPPARNH